MVYLIEQTDDEKLKMYMKCSKKQLAKMVIECNKHLQETLRNILTDNDDYILSVTE